MITFTKTHSDSLHIRTTIIDVYKANEDLFIGLRVEHGASSILNEDILKGSFDDTLTLDEFTEYYLIDEDDKIPLWEAVYTNNAEQLSFFKIKYAGEVMDRK